MTRNTTVLAKQGVAFDWSQGERPVTGDYWAVYWVSDGGKVTFRYNATGDEAVARSRCEREAARHSAARGAGWYGYRLCREPKADITRAARVDPS